MLVNHTASKSEKYSKRSSRKQRLSRKSYIKQYQFKFICKTAVTYKVYTNEDERQVSKNKVMEGGS